MTFMHGTNDVQQYCVSVCVVFPINCHYICFEIKQFPCIDQPCYPVFLNINASHTINNGEYR